eukprot:Opistho-2@51034
MCTTPPWMSLVPEPVRICGYVLFWYILSIGLTFFNKWMYSSYGLKYPLSITTIHFLYGLGAASFARWMRTRWSLGPPPLRLSLREYARGMAPAGVFSAIDIGLSNRSLALITVSLVTVIKSTTLVFLLIFSIAFRLERFRWPLLLVVISIAAGAALFSYDNTSSEQPIVKTIAAVIAPSPTASVYPSVDDGLATASGTRALGCILALAAAVVGGLRWVLVQAGMQRRGAVAVANVPPKTSHSPPSNTNSSRAGDAHNAHSDEFVVGPVDSAAGGESEGETDDAQQRIATEDAGDASQAHSHKMHPMDGMFYISPTAFLTLLPFAAALEGSQFVHSSVLFGASNGGTLLMSVLIIVSAANIAFFMTLAEYLLVQRTSSLSFAVAGMVKEVVTILLSVVIFGDRHSPMNYAGLAISLCGIGMYNYIKYTAMRDPTAFTAASLAPPNNSSIHRSNGDGEGASHDGDAGRNSLQRGEWRGRMHSATADLPQKSTGVGAFFRTLGQKIRSALSRGRAYRTLPSMEDVFYDSNEDGDIVFDVNGAENFGMVDLASTERTRDGAPPRSGEGGRGTFKGGKGGQGAPAPAMVAMGTAVAASDDVSCSDVDDDEETVLWSHGEVTSAAPRPASARTFARR